MNFTIQREIKGRVLSTSISFLSLGNETTGPKEEFQIFEKMGYPMIDTGGIFSGKIEIVDGKILQSEEDSAQKISFILNSETRAVDPEFKVEMRVNLNTVKDSMLNSTLNTKLKLAEARCLLFETTIQDRLEKAIGEIMSKTTFFEEGYPKNFTI